MARKSKILSTILFFLLFCGCEEKVKGGEITVRNDIMDDSYNSFVLDQISTSQGQTGLQKTLKPGEEYTIPAKRITGMRFTRRYKDHSKVYVIKCPPDANRKVQIKLIDVHSNRIAGGCVLTKRGRTEAGFTNWEK